MALYKFTIPAAAQSLVYDGVTICYVHAATEAAALVLVKATSTKDNDVVWDNATAEIVSSEIEGAVYNVVVDAPVLDVSYTAVEGDTFLDVGTALAALLVSAGVMATWTPNATHGALLGNLVIATGDPNAAVQTETIVDAGTAYTNADLLTVSGGTFATACTITADTTAGGLVTVASITGAGDYSVLPANPVSVTGGTGGNDVTFNLTWNAEQPGAGNVTATVVDANAVDVAAASVGNVVDAGAATASLSLDILATGQTDVSADGVIGLH